MGGSKSRVAAEGIDESILSVPLYRHHPSQRSSSGYAMAYKIGEGSFADVRVAFSRKSDNRKVVIKQIHFDYVAPMYREQLTWEFNILSQLTHPNIVELIEVYRYGKEYFMVMEFLSGGEMFDAICEKQFYHESDARNVMRNIADAVRYMHERNVVHRDVKPENLVLSDKTPNAVVKLVDFGFARVLGNDRDDPCDLRGTALYVAPEMIAKIPYGKPVDIWSMGCNFFILLSGVVPFEAKTTEELYPLISAGKFDYFPAYWKHVSAEAQDLINHMLELDPARRYTIHDVLNHPWMKRGVPRRSTWDISSSLDSLRKWNAARKLKDTAVAVKSIVKFQLAGARHRRALLVAARHAIQLEKEGISWKLTSEEIEQRLLLPKSVVGKAEQQHGAPLSILEGEKDDELENDGIEVMELPEETIISSTVNTCSVKHSVNKEGCRRVEN